MIEKKPLIVVLSRNYSTGLCVIRSLGSKGYPVDLIASAKKKGASKVVSCSKYVRNSIEIVSAKVNGGGDAQLLDALLSYAGCCAEKPILLPTDDYTTSVMDLNRDKLQDIFIMPEIVGGGAGSLKHHMDKSVQGEIARSVGILTPKEWVISLKEDSIQIPADMIYPCYCKPLESSLGYKQEMARCDSSASLETHLYKLKDTFENRSVLVQEFLEIDEEIDLEGVCLDQKIILPGIIWKEIVAKYDKGVPLAGKTFPLDVLGGFQEKIVSMLQKYHYTGMFDLGFNIVNNRIYFNELNMRSGGTNYVYYKSGVNLPEIFVKEVLGIDHEPEEAAFKEFGLTYLYENVAWDDYLHDYLDEKDLTYWSQNADILFMHDDIDVEPERVFIENVQKRKENKLRRAMLIGQIAEGAGWDIDTAKRNFAEAKRSYGVSLKDYVKFELWKYDDPDEQEREYQRLLERRERIREQRAQCIAKTMQATGWEETFAKQKINETRKILGVSYKDYAKAELWKYDDFDEQRSVYQKLLEKRERIKKQKEDCILNAMELASWERDFAIEQIKDARARLGISFKDYQRYQLCLVPIDEQKVYYERMLSQKGNSKKKRN